VRLAGVAARRARGLSALYGTRSARASATTGRVSTPRCPSVGNGNFPTVTSTTASLSWWTDKRGPVRVFMAMTFVVFIIYGVAASALRRHVIERPEVIQRVRRLFAASFVGLGVKLATTSR
jgi:threonine/homoserine/homoserine lactone efflux protein